MRKNQILSMLPKELYDMYRRNGLLNRTVKMCNEKGTGYDESLEKCLIVVMNDLESKSSLLEKYVMAYGSEILTEEK